MDLTLIALRLLLILQALLRVVEIAVVSTIYLLVSFVRVKYAINICDHAISVRNMEETET